MNSLIVSQSERKRFSSKITIIIYLQLSKNIQIGSTTVIYIFNFLLYFLFEFFKLI